MKTLQCSRTELPFMIENIIRYIQEDKDRLEAKESNPLQNEAVQQKAKAENLCSPELMI